MKCELRHQNSIQMESYAVKCFSTSVSFLQLELNIGGRLLCGEDAYFGLMVLSSDSWAHSSKTEPTPCSSIMWCLYMHLYNTCIQHICICIDMFI